MCSHQSRRCPRLPVTCPGDLTAAHDITTPQLYMRPPAAQSLHNPAGSLVRKQPKSFKTNCLLVAIQGTIIGIKSYLRRRQPFFLCLTRQTKQHPICKMSPAKTRFLRHLSSRARTATAIFPSGNKCRNAGILHRHQ